MDEKGDWLYFSSNAAGNYHIYRQSLADKHLKQLTQGAVTDMSPAIDRDKLYFVRHDAQGARLMCRDSSGSLSAMKLPRGIKDIRDLEIH